MNYQHIYHAGNSADIFKHLVVMALCHYLRQKEKPFCYIDTHAGNGKYDLLHKLSNNGNKPPEWHTGIGQLKNHSPSQFLLTHYLTLAQDLQNFPGSPAIVKALLRPSDEMILIEKADAAYQRLKTLYAHDKQVHIHHADAYAALNALLPPPIKRGLVLIDPPYEEKEEFEKLKILFKQALKKFPGAIYAVWYPVKSRELIEYFYKSLKKEHTTQILQVEFCPWPADIGIRLNGSGMIIFNPPWQISQTLTPLLEELIQALRQHPKGFYAIR